jgi:lyso-ornithine lipid O-acyltransferase
VRLVRLVYRLLALAFVSLTGLGWYFLTRLFGRKYSHSDRTQWLQRTCRRFLRAIGTKISVHGEIPHGGMIASNHLSYVDIIALSTITGCSFVSKMEVKSWPIFGDFAKLAGTVFVRRESRNDAMRAQSELQEVLANGECVVLFPEGTTTDASHVLPFRSPMFQAAIESETTITPCAISYALVDGDVGKELCYWGDMTLVPHLLNLFTKQNIWCSITFGGPLAATGDRKLLADDLQWRVAALKVENDKKVLEQMKTDHNR